MLTAIDYLTKKGWIISSDPRTYDNYPKNYGYRNYTENGINYDAFCDGYHRAFDLYTNETNDVPAVTSGTVVESNDYGNFGGTLVIKDANDNDWIYGHLQRGSLRFIVGDKVNQGDIVGLQGNSNYYDNPMSAHLHLQLRPKDAPKDEKSQVCSGLPMEKYDITNLNKKQDKSKNGSVKEMKHIYSNHIEGRKLTAPKPSIQGVVIHNDYGSMTPTQYLPWLYARENNGQYVNGWASVYANRNEALWYHPTDYVEWHCGNQYANNNYIGFEVCESYPGRISDKLFIENEEATLKVAADVMKSYNLPVNRNTVRLHNEFFATSCPHRSWEIHVGKGAPYTVANQNKMKDYFISRIKFYYNGGKLNSDNAKVVEQKDVKKEVKSNEKKQAVTPTNWQKNQYGTLWKNQQGTFKNGNEEIQVWNVGPFRINGNEAGKLPKGATIEFDEIMLQDGHFWVGYDSFEGDRLYLPVGQWNGKTPFVLKDVKLWGTYTEKK